MSTDPRRRNLLVLGGATLGCVALASLALFQQSQSTAARLDPHPVFPGLSETVNDLGEISITTKSTSFHARFVKDKGWVIPERNSYPADEGTVRATALGLAGMEITEQKTARAENMAALGLGLPDKGGDATRISLADLKGAVKADLLIGRNAAQNDSDGRIYYYVRKPAENQAWLARGLFTPKIQLVEWLDRNVVAMARDRIGTVRLSPPGSGAYVISRKVKTDDDFAIENMPSNRELSYGGAATGIAIALTDFGFDDVRPAAQVDFSAGSDYVAETFDGLSIAVKTVQAEGHVWAHVEAHALKPDMEKEAAAINAKTGAWAFQLPSYKAELFRASRETLLKAPGAKTP